jgi:hypothetical protein
MERNIQKNLKRRWKSDISCTAPTGNLPYLIPCITIIVWEHPFGTFMHNGFGSRSGLRLAATALCILLIVLPGTVCAEQLTQNTTPDAPVNDTTTLETPEITVQPTTGVAANTSYDENATVSLQPPLILFNRTDIRDFTSTVYGTATPGSPNTTITFLRWDWGDNGTPEYHEFPYSHNYHSETTLSVTA